MPHQRYPPHSPRGSYLAGWNHTCLRTLTPVNTVEVCALVYLHPTTLDISGVKRVTTANDTCSEITDGFETVSSIEDMLDDEICSHCWVDHYAIMQQPRYALYDDFIKSQLKGTLDRCSKSGDSKIAESRIDRPE